MQGGENSAGARAGAHNTLNDLKATIVADLPSLISTPSPVPFNGSTPTFSVGDACPAGDAAISPVVQVVGVCKHPGCSTATTTRSATASR